MFDWLKRKRPPTPPGPQLRDVLFGDAPLALWSKDGASGPWADFARAHRAQEAGDADAAREHLEAVLGTPGLESRHHLQAWHALRALGVQPPAERAKHLHGVVVEVHLPEGLDVLAAYEDGSARYLNHAGGATVWDRPDASMDARVEALLAAGRSVVAAIGPWEGARPPPPSKGHARLCFLTPSGLHFGQGPLDVLSREPLAAPVVAAATELMRALVEATLSSRDRVR